MTFDLNISICKPREKINLIFGNGTKSMRNLV